MNIQEEAAKVYAEGVEGVEKLLLRFIDSQQQLMIAYQDVASWSNRWKETHMRLFQLSKDHENLIASVQKMRADLSSAPNPIPCVKE